MFKRIIEAMVSLILVLSLVTATTYTVFRIFPGIYEVGELFRSILEIAIFSMVVMLWSERESIPR